MATSLELPRAALRRGGLHLSLRTKGILAVTVLVACVVLTGLFVARQREDLIRAFAGSFFNSVRFRT